MIPYGRQDITDADIQAVRDVLTSDFLTQGPAVPLFEYALAQRCAAPHAIAMNSATSALHVACLALGLGPGDVAWTCPNSFVASANCIRYCGAEVDFVDMDPRTRTLSIPALTEKLIQAERIGRLPKIVIPVHFGGLPCDMVALADLGRRYGFRIIEDASHAVGASLHDHPIGACKWSDITVFSFHPVKIITSAEGGAALCHDSVLADRMARLRSHGITREPSMMTQPSHGPWYYEQVDLGFNYRMTDLQAALGRSQLTRLDHYIQRRRAIAARYDAAFGADPRLKLPYCPPGYYSAWHLYPIELTGPAPERLRLFNYLRDHGLGVQVHYIPIHIQPDYQRLGFAPGQFPMAEAYYARTMSIPLFPAMTEDQIDQVIHIVQSGLDNRT